MANKQTEASKKYQEKVGVIAKSYKLRKTLVDDFAQACAKSGVSQAWQLSKMMQDYIDECKK